MGLSFDRYGRRRRIPGSAARQALPVSPPPVTQPPGKPPPPGQQKPPKQPHPRTLAQLGLVVPGGLRLRVQQLGAAAGSRYPSTVLADNPLLYLRLEEPSGATCANSGSLGGNATAATAFTRNTASHAGLGVGVTLAAGGTITYPANASLDITGDITMEFWVNFTTSQTAQPYTKGAGSYEFQIRPTDMRVNQSTVTVLATATSTVPFDSAWHHVVWTRIGNNYAFYIDNVSAGTATQVTNPTASGAASVTSNYTGVIDEIAIYNTGLSPTRIAAHYAAAA